MIAKL